MDEGHRAGETARSDETSGEGDGAVAQLLMLLYPGAGSGADHSSLVEIEQAVGRAGVPGGEIHRLEFAYRSGGRRPPPRAPVLLAEIRAHLDARLPDGGHHDADPPVVPDTVARRPIVLGGRSMGGRMCSMIAAGVDGLGPPPGLIGLVLIAYPLHPPKRPDRLRTDHFDGITVPTLFVSGTRDEFGSPDELTTATGAIPGPVEHVWIDGGRHELRGADAEIAAAVAAFVERITRAAGATERRRRG